MKDDTFNRIGRFVIRPDSKGIDDKLMLGCSFQADVLKPGTVYEIQEILGQLMIVEVGESSCKYSHKYDTRGGIAWVNDAGRIINAGTHLMTDKEYDEMINKERIARENI